MNGIASGTGLRCRWWPKHFVEVVFAMLISTATLSATSIRPPDFGRLVRESELIFTGRVLEQRGAWKDSNGRRSIVTQVTLAVDQVHKGHTAGSLTLEFLGGTVGDVTLEVGSMPRFQPGERVVLFVEKETGQVSPLVGLCHGKFALRRDAAGQETVCAHDGVPVSDVREIGRPRARRSAKQDQPALTHDAFAARIRAATTQP